MSPGFLHRKLKYNVFTETCLIIFIQRYEAGFPLVPIIWKLHKYTFIGTLSLSACILHLS